MFFRYCIESLNLESTIYIPVCDVGCMQQFRVILVLGIGISHKPSALFLAPLMMILLF